MRVAPLAVNYQLKDIKKLDMEGAQLAAITHGHSLGYMPAAVLVHVINRIVFPPEGEKMPLKEIVLEARDTVSQIFEGDPHLRELVDIIDRAVMLSENGADDLENIHQLGEGWVAEETLGISLYCSLRHQDSFSAGVIAAVNHRGDSDSTGAVTGNILGALLGYDAIDGQWKKDLELSDVILEIADDLCHGCQMSEYSHYDDQDWTAKYIHMHRPVRRQHVVFFWKDDEENGYLSNWFSRKFVIDDFEYLFVEQYMMARKAKLFHDSERYTAILRASRQWECKELGKQVKPFNSKAWDAVKYEVVKAANRAKFEQNADLMAKLLSTGDAILAEASPKDVIWGIGLDAAAASEVSPSDWPGQNLLGRILMELRTEFSGKQATKPETVLVLHDPVRTVCPALRHESHTVFNGVIIERLQDHALYFRQNCFFPIQKLLPHRLANNRGLGLPQHAQQFSGILFLFHLRHQFCGIWNIDSPLCSHFAHLGQLRIHNIHDLRHQQHGILQARRGILLDRMSVEIVLCKQFQIV